MQDSPQTFALSMRLPRAVVVAIVIVVVQVMTLAYAGQCLKA